MCLVSTKGNSNESFRSKKERKGIALGLINWIDETLRYDNIHLIKNLF